MTAENLSEISIDVVVEEPEPKLEPITTVFERTVPAVDADTSEGPTRDLGPKLPPA